MNQHRALYRAISNMVTLQTLVFGNVAIRLHVSDTVHRWHIEHGKHSANHSYRHTPGYRSHVLEDHRACVQTCVDYVLANASETQIAAGFGQREEVA